MPLLARLSWAIHECAAYNHQPAPFMGNLPEASAQDVHYITQQEAALQETLRQAETLEKRSGEYRGQPDAPASSAVAAETVAIV